MKFFNRKLKTDSYTSLIAKEVFVAGNISFNGVMKVDGKIDGQIISRDNQPKDCLIVAGSTIGESIQVANVVISGTVKCETLWVEDTLRVLAGADVMATKIYYRTLEAEPGALIQGELIHLDHVSQGEQT